MIAAKKSRINSAYTIGTSPFLIKYYKNKKNKKNKKKKRNIYILKLIQIKKFSLPYYKKSNIINFNNK